MYVKITSGQPSKYPYTIGDFRRDNPNVSYPRVIPENLLAAKGVFKVTQDPMPEFNLLTQEAIQETLPTKRGEKGSEWVIGWVVQDLPQDAAEQNVRYKRDALLAESDWTQVVDAPVDQTAWAAYRQALRDVTAQAGFPYSVEWPVKPE